MATDPAFKSQFYARNDILSILGKRLDAFKKGYRQNVGLLGKPAVGKTSILYNFLNSVKDPSIITVYIEIQNEPFSHFAQRFMGALLKSYFSSRMKDVPADLNKLVIKSRSHIPKTVKRMRFIKKLLAKKDYDKVLEELFKLSEILHSETGRMILLILDEFDLLEQFSVKDPFSTFGKEIMVEKSTMYVVASSRVNRGRNIFREKLAVLFGNFEVINVGRFDFETSKNFVKSRLLDLKMPERLCDFIIQITDGHPYYLSILLTRLFLVAKENKIKEISKRCVAQALEKELFLRDGLLSLHVSSLLSTAVKGKTPHNYFDVLLAVSLGYRKAKEITRFTEYKLADVKKTLAKLIDEELLEKSGAMYFIDDPILKLWLKNVYYMRRLNLDIDLESLCAKFSDSIIAMIDRVLDEAEKELPQRVENLFKCFKNDVVEINKKRFKCPSFKDVSSKPSNGRMFPVIGKGQGSRWVCQVVEKKLDEDDVSVLLEDAKRLRSRVKRKILIALNGVDLNAKLLAKEEKIAIWHLKDLNLMLELYSKPKVIV